MTYFTNFPQILYSFSTGQTIDAFAMTDITRRVKIDDFNIQNTLSYDEYDVIDGDTPEIIADKLYNNPEYHWTILIANEIIDPRYDWPLDVRSLQNYISSKYGVGNEFAVHHYENTSGDTIYYKAFTGVVNAGAEAGSSISVTGTGTTFNTEILATGLTVRFGASTTAYTIVAINSATSITVSGSAITSPLSAATMIDNNSYAGVKTTVTNTEYEEALNEAKRRIKVVKPEFVSIFTESFVGLLKDGR